MRKTSAGALIFSMINTTFMLAVLFIMLFPYVHVLAKAFNQGLDTMRGGVSLWPRLPTLENFTVILQDKAISTAAMVSAARVLCAVVLGLAVQFGAAYAMTKTKLPGRTGFLMLLMVPMFFNAGLIPTYILYSRIGMLNSFWVYVLPGLFSFYNMVIIRTFMSSTIPDTLEESAVIDGANEVIIFVKIILPLCRPILATIALWIMVGQWNDWVTTLYYVNIPALHTLQYKMMEVVRESERIQKMIAAAIESGRYMEVQMTTTSEALVAAQIVVTTIPIIMVYPFLQKYFVKGVMIGAVKG